MVVRKMKRIYAIDYLKFFAAFAVVVIHANAFEEVQLFGLKGETLDAILESLSRFAVPFFFMASGYLLGDKMNGPAIRQYIGKILAIYLSWTVFYLVLDIIVVISGNIEPLAELRIYFQEKWSLTSLLYLGNPTNAPHLWYLSATIWSTLLLYLATRMKWTVGLLITSLLLNGVGILDLLPDVPTREAFFLGVFYTTSGYFLSQHEERVLSKIPKNIFWLLPLFFIGQVVEGLFFFTADYFFSTILLTWLLFLWALCNPQFGKDGYMAKVGASSVYIYLLHWFYLVLIRMAVRYFDLQFVTESLWWGLSLPFVLFFSSYYSAVLVKKKEG